MTLIRILTSQPYLDSTPFDDYIDRSLLPRVSTRSSDYRPPPNSPHAGINLSWPQFATPKPLGYKHATHNSYYQSTHPVLTIWLNHNPHINYQISQIRIMPFLN